LQIGASYYNDERVPDGIPHVHNSIAGAYLIYITSNWEFLNEFQLQRDRSVGSTITYNTPLGYTQISHKFGKYRPYFRWQEVNVLRGAAHGLQRLCCIQGAVQSHLHSRPIAQEWSG
jgi:hypothetical protein